MNIKEIEIDLDEVWRKYVVMGEEVFPLIAIFNRQRELMETYHDIEAANGAVTIPQNYGPGGFGDLDNRLVQIRLKDMIQRVDEELGEAANCLKNKPWKQDWMPTDVDHFYEEIADAFHFFVEFCITAGLGAEDLFKLYFAKSEVNKFRQRTGY